MAKGKKVVYVTKRATPSAAQRDPATEPHPSPYTDEVSNCPRVTVRGSV
jgi:hypothetical protein